MSAAHLRCGLIALASSVAAQSAFAVVRRVPSEYPTIQAAVDSSSAGDTVLVDSGIYTDHQTRIITAVPYTACVFLKTGVNVVSADGLESTSIHTVNTPAAGMYAFFGYSLGPDGTLVEGFAVSSEGMGSAVLVSASHQAKGGRVTFRSCGFWDLSGTHGAMQVGRTDLELVDCVFERCSGHYGGGVIHGKGNLRVSGCTFKDCQGVALQSTGSPPDTYSAVVENSRFVGNVNHEDQGLYGGLLLGDRGGDCEVRDCVFFDNECTGPGAGAAIATYAEVTVERCVFWNNRSTQSFGSGLIMYGRGLIHGCTFSANSGPFHGGAVVVYAGPSEFSNNIVANSLGGAALRVISAVVTGGCNMFWSNAGGDAMDYTFSPTDRIADPLFCDGATGDLTLQPISPCLPMFSLGCGLIGALEQGCGTVSVEADSWGGIKAAYR